MGALSGFLRGVAGPGLVEMSNDMQRQGALDQQQAFRADQNAQNLAIREEIAAMRASNAKGGSNAPMDPAEEERAVIARIAQSQGVSLPEAQQMLQAYKTGQNPFGQDVRTNDSDVSGMDRRLGAGQTFEKQPDVARFKALMSKIGQYYSEAGSRNRSNYDQLKKGEQTDFETTSGQAAQANPAMAGTLGQGVAVSGGKPLFHEGGDNVYTGVTGALTAAKVKTEGAKATENLAQAGNANASAEQHRAAVDKLKAELNGDLSKQSPERLTTTLNAVNGLIRTYDQNSMDPSTVAARSELQAMARQIANELKRKGLGQAASADAPKPPKDSASLDPAPQDIKQRVVGKTYQSPRGPVIWMGNGWKLANG